MRFKILPGSPYPLGATWDGIGVNFAIFSENAARIELCLFEDLGANAKETISLLETTGHVWHCYIPGLSIGQLYGYRVYGPYDPERGLRFNPAKLLIDPYAQALAGEVDWAQPIFPYKPGGEDADLQIDETDDAPGVPKGVVATSVFDWQNDRPPLTPLHDRSSTNSTSKGLQRGIPIFPKSCAGTYAGLASPPCDPVPEESRHHGGRTDARARFPGRQASGRQGTHNYWGYNTINFFAPDARYSSSGDRGRANRRVQDHGQANCTGPASR